MTNRSTVIERTRLDEHFAAATGKLIRVLAPAGYGKSTLISRWVGSDPRDVRWLDLEPIDNDPMVLAHTLSQALSGLGPSGPDATPRDATAALVAGCTEPFVLVLDDVHHIESQASAELLELVIANLPWPSTLVLAGRAFHHSGAIARFRLDPGVIDLFADDLAFDLAETEELFTSMGVESDIDALAEITDQFEGWPAGLRLAGIVVASRTHGVAASVRGLGEIDYITDYITEEWFGILEPADQTVLLETGCLGRFSGDMCDSVLGMTDSRMLLRRLCHDELMFSALDWHGDWYRLHPLLQRWLSSRLRSQDRARWREIHVSAAHWWEREGDIDLAIEHAATAGDLGLCERLITTYMAGLHRPGDAAHGPTVAREPW